MRPTLAPRALNFSLTVAPSHVLGPLGFPVASEGKGGGGRPGILQKEPKTLNKGRKTPEDKQGSMPVQRGHQPGQWHLPQKAKNGLRLPDKAELSRKENRNQQGPTLVPASRTV